MRAPWSLLILLVGCAPPDPAAPPDDTAVAAPSTIAALRADEVGRGFVDLVDVRVVSGLTDDHASAYLQDRTTGDGAELRLGDVGLGELPDVGTPVSLRAYFEGASRAPVLWLLGADALVVQGEPETPWIAIDPAAPRPLDLVRFGDVTVTSEPDPTGVADTSLGRALDGRFGVELPPLGNRGALTGVLLGDGGVAPRADDDWAGPREPAVVVEATLDDVIEGRVPVGGLVALRVLQATPWTRDGRAALVQGEDGRGVWLDTEAFGHAATTVGDVLDLRAEVREQGGVRGLRSWWFAPSRGKAVPVVVDVLGHGVLVEVTLSGFGRPGWTGERVTAEGWTLDDRFFDLAALPDPSRVVAAVDASTGTTRLAVLASDDQVTSQVRPSSSSWSWISASSTTHWSRMALIGSAASAR